MTFRIGNAVIIHRENPQQCDLCGVIAELRPYGPNGECICWECGLKDIDSRDKQMYNQLFDTDPPEGFSDESRKKAGLS